MPRLISTDATRIEVLLPPFKQRSIRRRSDRPVPLTMEVIFSQEGQTPGSQPS